MFDNFLLKKMGEMAKKQAQNVTFSIEMNGEILHIKFFNKDKFEGEIKFDIPKIAGKKIPVNVIIDGVLNLMNKQ